jgi:DNA polymerase III alpha subunit
MKTPDIDIDFADRNHALEFFQTVAASRREDGKLVRHNTGVYFQDVPVDADTNLCAVDYQQAEKMNYFKIDFLNAGIYKDIKNEDHLDRLANQEPLWDLLEQDDFVNLLFHVNGHGSILRQMKPRTVEELAAVLAVIRPAKRYLIGKDWNTVLEEVWIKPEGDEYYFKKSHATAYALAIVVQMNLICERISYDYS